MRGRHYEKDFVITRFVNICWSVFKLGALFAVFVAIGLAVFLFTRLDDEIRRQAEQFLAEQLPQYNVSIRGARLVEGQGIAIYDLSISETSSTQLQSKLLVVDEIMFSCDAQLSKLVNGLPEVHRVLIRHPQVWAAKSRDGLWNWSSLLPLPACDRKKPEIIIENAQFTLADQSRSGLPPLSLRDVDLRIRPDARISPSDDASQPLTIEGSFGGPLVESAKIRARYDLKKHALALSTTFDQLEISDPLVAWASIVWGKNLQQTKVRGKVDGEIVVEHRLDSKTQPNIDATFHLQSMRVEDARLPRPLVDLSCVVRCENDMLSVKNLRAMCGPASVAAQLDRRGWSANAPMVISSRLENVPLDQKLYSSLPELLKIQWDKYQPTGVVDAEMQATYDGQRWLPGAALLTGRDLEFESDKFRYRVNKGSGTMRFTPVTATQPNTLDIDLVGYAGRRPLRFIGQVFDPKPGAIGWIEVTGTSLKIEDRMIAALPGKTRDVIESMHPQGKFNVRWRIDRSQVGQTTPHTSLRLELIDCRMNYDKFPYPLGGIHGLVLAEDKHWTFRDLVSHGSRTVRCQGHLHPRAQQGLPGNELSLQIWGEQIPLDDDLRNALPPNVGRAWLELRPRGNVDLQAKIDHISGSSKPTINVAVSPQPESTTIEPKFFPYPMDLTSGTFSYRNGKLLLSQLRARNGRTTVSTNGDGEFLGDGSWRVRLEGLAVDRLMPRRDLTDALPVQLRNIIEFLKPSGSFNLSNGILEFAKAGGTTAPVNSSWDIELNCLQANIQAGLEVNNIHGTIRLQGANRDGKSESVGELAIDTATFQDVQFTEIQGPLWVNEGLCLFGEWATERIGKPTRHLTARLYDGYLRADSWISFDVVPEYSVVAEVTGASLSRMMKERINGELDYQGNVRATFTANGKGRSLATLVGHGEVQITEANIHRLAPLVSMLKLLRNETPDTTAFNQVESTYRIQGPHIYLDKLDFKGDAVSLLGRGETNFDHQLNLDFHPVVGRDEIRLPFFKNLVKGAGRQTLRMSVSGTLSDPQVSTQALPGINNLIKQLELTPSTTTTTPRAAERNPPAWPRRGLQ
ncbi:MAG: hypothetical protein AAGD11_08295 [Planctomycetota bacterium]